MLKIIQDLHRALRIRNKTGRIQPKRPDLSIQVDGPQEIVAGDDRCEYNVKMIIGRLFFCRPNDYDLLVSDVIASIHEYLYGDIIDGLRELNMEMRASEAYHDDKVFNMLKALRDKISDRGPRL
jgi:hypothetical protein